MNSQYSGVRPLVSVIIPVYNTERYVSQTLDSVLAQTYEALEIVVVIDGSTDRSLDVCRDYKDSRIHIIEQENQGLAAARNTGVRASTGGLIGFIDSDDTWHPDKVELHVRQFAADPGLGLAYSYSALMDEHGKSFGTFQKEGRDATTFADIFVRNVVGNGSNAVLRREVFEGMEPAGKFPALVGFDPQLRRAEDYEFWCRIAATTEWKISGLPRPLVNYRINPYGLSSSLYKQRSYHFLAMAKVADYAPDRAEQLRTKAVAHTYWHQARLATIQYDSSMGRRVVKSALWYDWKTLSPNHLMICLAVLSSFLLPERVYYVLQRKVSRLWGLVQRVQMKWLPRRRGPKHLKIRPAESAVKSPESYVRKKAMPDLFFLCHRHRFMFLAISKNASASVKNLMYREEQGKRQEGGKALRIHRYWGFNPREGYSVLVGDKEGQSNYKGYLKFVVYSNPVERFLSAYHHTVLFSPRSDEFYKKKRLEGMGLEQFIRVTESILRIENPAYIDEHLRPQSRSYGPDDVDYVVPIAELPAFLRRNFGIKRSCRQKQTTLPQLSVTEEQRHRIHELYAGDYGIKTNWEACDGPHSSSVIRL